LCIKISSNTFVLEDFLFLYIRFARSLDGIVVNVEKTPLMSYVYFCFDNHFKCFQTPAYGWGVKQSVRYIFPSIRSLVIHDTMYIYIFVALNLKKIAESYDIYQ